MLIGGQFLLFKTADEDHLFLQALATGRTLGGIGCSDYPAIGTWGCPTDIANDGQCISVISAQISSAGHGAMIANLSFLVPGRKNQSILTTVAGFFRFTVLPIQEHLSFSVRIRPAKRPALIAVIPFHFSYR
jgi:hypothetical protein